jgi:hypothetical protein
MATPTTRNTSKIESPMIASECPGTIVADFEALMDFIAGGVRSTGKYHLLPMARLNELDELMTTPLRPKLQRPQQRSFPHLNGLYLLLRATQIGVTDGQGKTKGKLILDPFMCQQWTQLNPTEKYCNLLEAWFGLSSWASLGLKDTGWYKKMGMDVRSVWQAVPSEGRRFSENEQVSRGFLYSQERSTTLALLELFGLITVERGAPVVGQGWTVAKINHTRFGDEVLTAIFAEIVRSCLDRDDDDEQADLDFGAFQPALQSIFPQWINNLKFPEPEFRDGIYYFKVSLGRPWRRIAIAAENSLEELADCIIRAFDFDGDHLYEFQLPQPDGTILTAAHPNIQDADLQTDEFAIGHLTLVEGQSIPFVYDFGANWKFTVKLEEVKPPDPEITRPIIVESHGEAPAEYDDEW